ncbi:MAG: winged helix-turn-helix transcriptional regulator [Alphaproteobacteria bacterium]|nr:winged helix-turn-helix transcriptional regulator [Alphaproteobacteria bacterium]
MTDIPSAGPARNNLRSLVYFLGEIMDRKIAERRKGTPYEKVRPSDIRVFVTAARSEMSISEVARELGVSRQTVQASVQRLVTLGVVEVRALPGSRRDKLVGVTARGALAQKTAQQQILAVEADLAALVGEEKFEDLRQMLEILVSSNA